MVSLVKSREPHGSGQSFHSEISELLLKSIEVSLKKTIRDIPALNWLIKVLRFSVNPEDLSSALYVLTDHMYGDYCNVYY